MAGLDKISPWIAVESGQKGLTAAQNAFETVEARYQVGSANFVDLTTAQAALVYVEAANV